MRRTRRSGRAYNTPSIGGAIVIGIIALAAIKGCCEGASPERKEVATSPASPTPVSAPAPKEVPSSEELCSKVSFYQSGLYTDEPWQFRKGNPWRGCTTTDWNGGNGTSDCLVGIHDIARDDHLIGNMRVRFYFRNRDVVGFQLLAPRPGSPEGGWWGQCRATRRPCDKGLACRDGTCEPAYWFCAGGSCRVLSH